MSKRTRALVLAATLAAMNLAGLTAVAHAQSNNDPDGKDARRPPTERQVGEPWRHGAAVTQDGRRPPTERQVEAPDHHRRVTAQQATADAARRAALAQEHYYSTWGYGDPAVQQALAQERYYSTWGYSNTPAPAPAKPSGQPSWLVPGLGVAAVALASGLAVLAAKRSRRRVRVGQAA